MVDIRQYSHIGAVELIWIPTKTRDIEIVEQMQLKSGETIQKRQSTYNPPVAMALTLKNN